MVARYARVIRLSLSVANVDKATPLPRVHAGLVPVSHCGSEGFGAAFQPMLR